MKKAFAGALIVMGFSLFGNSAKASSEDRFWSWFAANEARLFEFEKDQEAIFDSLQAELQRINSDLTFEFGPVKDGAREFVISAGGIKSAFAAVESTYAMAPSLKRWVWVKFRPRRWPLSDLEYGGKKVRAEEVRYLLAKDGDRAGIVLFFDGYNEQEKGAYGQMAYLLLDEALGEYAVEAQVGFIEFHSTESKYFSQSSPLPELPQHFDEYFRSRAH
ncbi:hypothetical protein [Peristeroidobacter agariperforans]|uniref:hypothetical protein n=1 Tax=Peristeroidobacter agariperforans TaxID=268404 RepID=UPI00101BADC4|nr:hypothetical protein [Peristeroidobacter agariperforans]